MNPHLHDPLPTGLDLDPRQRAMLAEMKIPYWWPQAAATSLSPAKETAAVRPTPLRTPSGSPAAPTAATVHAAGPLAPTVEPLPAAPGADQSVAQMDWTQLRNAVQACSACGLCEGRKAPVLVADPMPSQADWLIVGEPPDELEERAGVPFVGPAGQLLDNMLRAVQLTRNGRGKAGARLTPVVKCRPQVPRNPEVDELARCAVYLHREIELTQPRVIVAMGRFAAWSLLGRAHPELLQLPFGQMRGKVYRCMGIPVVVTYPPSKLLRAPLQKAQAWADLCLARAQAISSPGSKPP